MLLLGKGSAQHSSWGDAGFNGVWLNPSNDWIYRHLHMAEERMGDCARRHPHALGDLKRALNQMGRELLLAQSSDWAFIMTTGTVKWFNSTKGFGFIQPDEGGPNAFVHISAVERAGMREIVEGQKIGYEMERDRKSGKMSAGNLKAV